MDRIEMMRVFVRVADAGSFSRAADGLQLSRATVSVALQKLEAHLGVRLLHRTTRKVQLTLDGAAYYEQCQRLLAELEEVESLFRQTGDSPKGKVKIDLPGRVARKLIIPALPDFFARHPGIELDLGVTDRPVDLVQEGVDCAIRVGDLGDSRLVARRIGSLRQINCASPAYLARHGVPESLADLAMHREVHYASPVTGKIYDWEYLESGVSKALAVPGQVTVNNAEAYIACALAGLGLIQVPAYDMRELLAAAKLVEVLPQWPPPSLPVSVLYPHRRHLSRRVQVFVEWASGVLNGQMWPGGGNGTQAGA